MDTLPSPFTISLNGSPIANIAANAQDKTQATTGSEAAILTLKDGYLQQGDWVLGRNKTENRSLLPKEVYWFKKSGGVEGRVKKVVADRVGDNVGLRFDGAKLMVEDGKVFADLIGGRLLCVMR